LGTDHTGFIHSNQGDLNMHPSEQIERSVGTITGMAQANYAGQSSPQPPQPGIASRIGDLQKVVSDVRSLTYDLRAALGIACPSDANKQGQPASLADVLTDLRIELQSATSDLKSAIQHINS
jgi:hypothetical protein